MSFSNDYIKRIEWRMARLIKPRRLQDVLKLFSYAVPLKVIRARTARERAEAEDWACQLLLRAIDGAEVSGPPRPRWLDGYEVGAAPVLPPAWTRVTIVGPGVRVEVRA
jgi:hypothetical protein